MLPSIAAIGMAGEDFCSQPNQTDTDQERQEYGLVEGQNQSFQWLTSNVIVAIKAFFCRCKQVGFDVAHVAVRLR